MSEHDSRSASVLGRRSGPWGDPSRSRCDRPLTMTWSCRRCSAGSAVGQKRWSSAGASRRANGRGCARRFRRASFPGAGEVRLRQRGSSRARTERAEGAPRLRSASASDPLRRAGIRGPRVAGRRAAGASGTRGQPRDGVERRVGRASSDRRPRRGDWRRHSGLSRRVAGRRASRAARCNWSTSTRSARVAHALGVRFARPGDAGCDADS